MCAPLAADKQTFKQLDVVGWYATGDGYTEQHLQIHKTVSKRPLAGGGCSEALGTTGVALAWHGVQLADALVRLHPTHTPACVCTCIQWHTACRRGMPASPHAVVQQTLTDVYIAAARSPPSGPLARHGLPHARARFSAACLRRRR